MVVLSGNSSYAERQSDSDRQQAAALAAEGEQLGQDKRFDAALAKFKQAAELDPDTPAYLCNIGNAYYALASYPRAHLYLLRCKGANDDQWPDGVRPVFDYVEGLLSKQDYTPVTIDGTPKHAMVNISFFSDEGPSQAPVTVYLPFARYEVTVKADGYQPGIVAINARDRNPIMQTYVLTEAVGGGDTGDGMPPDGKRGDGTSGGTFEAGGDLVGGVKTASPARKKWPLLVVGGGVVAAGVGFWSFANAKDTQDGLFTCSEDPSCTNFDDRESKMQRQEIIAYSLWGVGAAAVGTGLFLYLTQSTSADNGVAVSAAPTKDGGMVMFSWNK